MSVESKKKNGKRRSFTEEFKAEAVRLVVAEGMTVASVALDLDRSADSPLPP